MIHMSKESERIIDAINKGELPDLDITRTDNSSTKGLEVELSQLGIQRNTFGLSSVLEGYSIKNDK